MPLICSSQKAPDWDKWTWLIGNWIGEGGGQPGQGSGTFSFSFDLDKNILVRKSHSEYPSTSTNTKITHDDLIIIYLNSNSEPIKAVYFDNERHIIFYSVTFLDNSIILTSDKSDNTTIFRLVYSQLDKETVNIRFEMSQDGLKFVTYVEGKSKKQNPSINSTDKINRANLRPTFSAGSRIRLTKQGFSSQRLTDSR
jgi:hypothetical protein